MSPPQRTLDALLDGLAVAPALAVLGLASDSWAVRPGDAFLALRGSRQHGLAHLPQALERGARAILWEPAPGCAPPQVPVPCVAVDALGWHAGEIAARFHGRPADRMFVAGVTGTDGKTSTAHLIAQAFEQRGRACAYVGTLGTGRLAQLAAARNTTPEPLPLQAHLADFVAAGIDACAMEVSSHGLALNRVGGVSFDAVVLTNLSRDHLDFHGSVEHYAAAKRRLFEPADGRVAILNRDDAYGAQWIAELSADARARQLCTYGIEGERPRTARFLIAHELRLHAGGLAFAIDSDGGRALLESRLLGRFNVYNLLAAAAVLLAAGLTLDAVVDALAHARTVPGRIEAFRAPGAPLVVVDYAHTPKALEQALSAVRAHTDGALHCVFGCGGDRDRGKRPLMGEVAARLGDRVTLTDDNPRSEAPQAIVADILAGVPDAARTRVDVEHDRARAIDRAIDAARAGDVILVAGKGHETTQTYGAQVRAFSDRAHVAARFGVTL